MFNYYEKFKISLFKLVRQRKEINLSFAKTAPARCSYSDNHIRGYLKITLLIK